MPQLEWSDALALDLPALDDTHREFVDLLATVQGAEDAQLLAHWSALIDHTQAHFGREDDWMQQTGFSSANCHSTQHHVVLEVMRECLKRGQAGSLGFVRQLAGELAIWFPQHAQSMDAALALHLRGMGFDAQTGIVHLPQARPSQDIQGCGGASCAPQSLPEASSTASA